MNSLKTTLVCVILLGVLYGMYQVINTPAPSVLEEEPPVVENFGAPVDPSQLDLLKDDPSFSMGESLGSTEPPQFESAAPGPIMTPDGASLQVDTSSFSDMESTTTTPQLGSPSSSSGSYQSNELALPSADNGVTSPIAASPDSPSEMGSSGSAADPQSSGAGLSMPSNRAPGNSLSTSEPGTGYPSGLATESTPTATTRQNEVANNEQSLGPDAPTSDAAATRKLSETWTTVELLVSKSRFQDALVLLSTFYENEMLTSDEQVHLQEWLDALAAKVIYSMDPTLEMPHIVRQGETLDQIAATYQIPPTLLYNVNRDRIERDGFKPGTELKVVRGPFRAEVNLTRQRLTLWLDNMYAGSFPIRVGREPSPETGTLRVADKTDKGRVYTAASGSPLPEMSPDNPYGKHLLDLGRGMLIHGSPESSGNSIGKGCIALEEAHARDIYEILDRNSEVRIIR